MVKQTVVFVVAVEIENGMSVSGETATLSMPGYTASDRSHITMVTKVQHSEHLPKEQSMTATLQIPLKNIP